MKVNIPLEGDPEVTIERHDTWNLDITLAHIIAPALGALVGNKRGVPNELVDLRGGDVDKGAEEWERRLQEMIWAFTQIRDDYNYKFTEEEYARLQRGLDYFGQHYMSLWY